MTDTTVVKINKTRVAIILGSIIIEKMTKDRTIQLGKLYDKLKNRQ